MSNVTEEQLDFGVKMIDLLCVGQAREASEDIRNALIGILYGEPTEEERNVLRLEAEDIRYTLAEYPEEYARVSRSMSSAARSYEALAEYKRGKETV